MKELIHEVNELKQEMAPPSPSFPPLEIPEIASGRIAIFLILFYLILMLLRIVIFTGPTLFVLIKHLAKPALPPPAEPSILFDYFLYMCLACQFFPLPTLPPVAFVSKIFSPILVAFVGALGTSIANLNDYAILGWLFRHHKVKKVRNIETYRKLLTFFDRYAFLTLTVAAFLPIPIDVIRMLAISRAYHFWKYIGATLVGRFPRYLMIAYLGKELPAAWILILFLLSTIPAVVKFVSDIVKKRKKGS